MNEFNKFFQKLTPQEFYDQRLPYAQAWREGKSVQWTAEAQDMKWLACEASFPPERFFLEHVFLRLEPSFTFVEWTSPQDVPIGAVFRSLDNQGVWRSPINFYRGANSTSGGIGFIFDTNAPVQMFTWKELLNDYEWSRDGKEWTTCGTRQEGSTLNREL